MGSLSPPTAGTHGSPRRAGVEAVSPVDVGRVGWAESQPDSEPSVRTELPASLAPVTRLCWDQHAVGPTWS